MIGSSKEKELTDNEVVQLVKAGDKSAFAILVQRHQKALVRLGYRFMKDVDQAEDVVQDSFIKAYQRISSFEERASFKSWLYQITINTAKNKLRSRHLHFTDMETMQFAVSPNMEWNLAHQSIAKTLQALIDKLPHRQKTALLLRVYDDMSFKEIAEVMDCPYDTAKANYRHALIKLRDELEKNEDLKSWSQNNSQAWEHIQGKIVDIEN